MLEYVASGLSAARTNHSFMNAYDENKAYFKEWFDYIRNNSEVKLSGLYNAYSEANYAEMFKKFKIYDDFHMMYADSGGLQIITRGDKIDDNLKDQIYRNQAAHAHFGMCFDEIPLQVLGERSAIGDMDSRLFDRDNLEDYAKATGKNIKRQIEVYKENNSLCKPCVIVHGNDYDSYMRWSEALLSEIPEEFKSELTSVAISSACIGVAETETEIFRNFVIKHLPFEYCNHSHLLGVGAIRRLLSCLIFYQNGYYEPDFRLSFDSTTHTKISLTGQYYTSSGSVKLTKDYNPAYDMLYNEVAKTVPFKYSIKEFYDGLTNPVIAWHEKTNDPHLVVQAVQALTWQSVFNFLKQLETYLHSKEKLLKSINRDTTLFESLYEVKTLDDYWHWKNNTSIFFKRKNRRILEEPKNTLDDLFS